MKIDKLTPETAILAELGERLTRVRKQRGHTQEALAREAGLGVATLRRIEDGKDSKLGSWLRLLKALDLHATIDNLLPENFRSPMADARAKRRQSPDGDPASFTWGDEKR